MPNGKVLALVGFLLVVTSTALATPVCVTGSLAQYQALGATGCTIGSTVFFDFVSGTFGSGPSPDSIVVSPFSGVFTTGPGLAGPIQPLTTFTAEGFQFGVNMTVGANQTESLSINYQMADPADIFSGAFLSLSGIADADLAITNMEELVGGCRLDASITLNRPQDACLFSPVSTLVSTNGLGLKGGNSFSHGATISSFTDLYITTTPEPSTFFLVGSGLIGVILKCRRKKDMASSGSSNG